MRIKPGTLATALGLTLALPLAAITASQTIYAQQQQPGQSQDDLRQVPLTDQQIEAFLAAQNDMDAILEKMPDQDGGSPDPKVISQLDSVAKKYKFLNYAEYDQVGGNIGLVIAGIDPDKKKYVGVDVVLKKQIAEVQADKQMSAKDKKEQLEDLNAQLQSVEPVKIPANIELVSKYYDKLNAAMSQDD
jgi:hypothetical protein